MAEPATLSAGTHRRPRLLPRSLRVRTTAIAAFVVACALFVGGFALVRTLDASMASQVHKTAELRAEDIARSIEAGATPATLTSSDQDEMFIQILDRDGRVVAATENIADHRGALVSGDSDHRQTIPDPTDDDDDDDDFIIAIEHAHVGSDRYTVLVGQSTDIIESSTELVVTLLAAGVPVLVLLVAITTWLVVGRTLAPVEAIRREVDAISSEALDRRVPDPGTRDEIARLAITMNRMLERLEAAQRRQRRFVSDASHELRSPVAAIRQHAEVALAHPETTTLDEFAGVVLDEDLRVQRLVEDLLYLARSDEGETSRNLRTMDLDDLVFAQARTLRDTTSLRIDTTGVSPVQVRGDAARLSRVLRNLADNAVRHATSTVRFSLRVDASTAVLTVADDGQGIPRSQRHNVFERFVRLDDARTRDTGGSGLGLAIVSEIVAAHHGTVTVGDSDLGGAQFEIRLPALVET